MWFLHILIYSQLFVLVDNLCLFAACHSWWSYIVRCLLPWIWFCVFFVELVITFRWLGCRGSAIIYNWNVGAPSTSSTTCNATDELWRVWRKSTNSSHNSNVIGLLPHAIPSSESAQCVIIDNLWDWVLSFTGLILPQNIFLAITNCL